MGSKSRSQKEAQSSQEGPHTRQFINMPTHTHESTETSMLKPKSVHEIATNDKYYGIMRPFSDEAQKEAGFEMFIRGVEDPEATFSDSDKRIGKRTYDEASARIKKREKK